MTLNIMRGGCRAQKTPDYPEELAGGLNSGLSTANSINVPQYRRQAPKIHTNITPISQFSSLKQVALYFATLWNKALNVCDGFWYYRIACNVST